ncbi:hypothetical protein [Hymenobacter convexus]|uniref:hypothetical protein n=1 Tax=Hymenobacter sp. CA1UV-4 TaxID=3063782 RepID=UPI002713730B|nr:hypothetical protein [Hymenobacter sp. CA1UV-4]MDO7851448.1 hypothetical protein [Hymenobacter sp. CA1UV-4]
MLAKRFFLVALSVGVVSCSHAPPVEQPKPALANTIWAPRTIAWVRPFPHDAELKGIQYADFPLLCFRSHGNFLRVSSYHSRGENDTIIVATEPSVRVDSGRYYVGPSRVVVISKTVYRTFKLMPADNMSRVRTDTISWSGRRLVYEGVEYCPYTKLSGRSMDSFWALTRSK